MPLFTLSAPDQDPLGNGVMATGIPAHMGSGSSNPGANAAQYAMIYGYGQSCSNLKLGVVTSNGNVSVGVYSSTGTGASRVPLTRRATSGAVACPAAGLTSISLGATITINKNDFAAFSTDSGTATFYRSAPLAGGVSAGTAANEGSAHPLPATSAAAAGSTQVAAIICA